MLVRCRPPHQRHLAQCRTEPFRPVEDREPIACRAGPPCPWTSARFGSVIAEARRSDSSWQMGPPRWQGALASYFVRHG
jgi:hypothetical protein